MQRILPFLIAILLWNCNDGDLQIETIDFDDVSIQTCESTITTATTVFFKINGDEALILDLQNGILANEASSDTIVSTLPGQSSLLYRVFSGTVSQGYFCDEIPATDPTVIEEIEAISGEVLINTVQNASDTTLYEHTILLRDVSLLNSQGERITDTSINDFGVVTTQD
ncbi:hypothetical protein [Muriicola soli]|uniref:Uncharacterized protein n=1 Tax=Muriicola soli TaxID=2507538 RepID=A0A411E7M4_9FLAO|nr:hypothetical protein [Muriicola soli]QBA63711.1 hypothetical protein EQY75_03635 [Muriicola soli]